MEVFDGKQTRWEGLWWHPEYNGFSSSAISLSDLRKFKGNVRLYVRKNKFYHNGENGRPNYCFSIKSADSPTFKTLEVEEDTAVDHDKIINELAEILRQGNNNGYGMPVLPSESYATAEYLEQRAKELVEELTGEEWNFTFLTWGY